MLNAQVKLATLAVAAAIGGGAMMMSAPALAVNVAQSNKGEVLLFPYYTVKNGYDTLLSVVNTTNVTAITKIRFREALNGRAVSDFNLVLSPYDVWVAVVTRSADGGALVRTWDKTCTDPVFPASPTAAGATEIGFSTALFTEAGVDASPAREQEGYFEILLMGVSSASTSEPVNVIEYNAKHGYLSPYPNTYYLVGTPRNCATVRAQFAPLSAAATGFAAPTNILSGHVTYINVFNGQAIDAEPTVLENFRNGSNFVTAPGDPHPNLNDGDNFTARSLVEGNPVTKTFTNSVNAVSALLSADAVVNQYASGTGAATSWIVTMPTKHHYVDGVGGTAISPFAQVFPTEGKSCDKIGFGKFTREASGSMPSGTEFNFPIPSPTLCYQANLIDFNGSTIFGTGTSHATFSTTDIGTSGWVHLGLVNTGNVGSFTSVTGLPVIGFAAIMRDAGGATVNYGSSAAHTYTSGNH